jgi:hypothetical protein
VPQKSEDGKTPSGVVVGRGIVTLGLMGPVGIGSVGNGSVGSETVGNGSLGNDTLGNGRLGNGKLGKGRLGRGSSGRSIGGLSGGGPCGVGSGFSVGLACDGNRPGSSSGRSGKSISGGFVVLGGSGLGDSGSGSSGVGSGRIGKSMSISGGFVVLGGSGSGSVSSFAGGGDDGVGLVGRIGASMSDRSGKRSNPGLSVGSGVEAVPGPKMPSCAGGATVGVEVGEVVLSPPRMPSSPIVMSSKPSNCGSRAATFVSRFTHSDSTWRLTTRGK